MNDIEITESKKLEDNITYMLSKPKNMPNKTKELDFNLNENSIISKEFDCFPACIAMSARYWKERVPTLNIPTDLDYWKRFQEKTSIGSIKGVSLRGIIANLKGFYEESEEIKSKELKDTRESEENITLNILETKLKLDPKTPARFSDLFAAFSNEPPIIQIIIFDKIYAIRKRTGTLHASIISQVDLEEKKITVIDPQNYDDNDIIVLYHFDLNTMARGWERAQNAVVWVYPIEAKKDFEIKSGKLKVVKYKKIKMDNFINN